MIKVLQIRETPLTKCAGIDANCQGLITLFQGDNQIELVPTIEYTRHSDPFIHQYWLDEREICSSIERFNPDIVHIHGVYSFSLYVAVKCAKKYNKRIVLSPHFHPFYSLRRPIMGKMFFELVTRRILNDVDLIFTINDEDTSHFLKYHKNVIKIPHWSKFDATFTKVDKDPKMILFVGRLEETNKGFNYLYDLPEGKYSIHCVGKGNVTLRNDMTKHTNILNSELKDLYQRASLLVVPSRYEAFSYVTIEALMSNTPVVLSDRVRIADHLTGIQGFSTFKYNDHESFVRAVSHTIGTYVDTASVASVFNPDLIKQKYKAAYISVYNMKITSKKI